MKSPLLPALATSLALICGSPSAQGPGPSRVDTAQPPKVLRYAFRIAETGFDPPQVTDLYSNTIIANIFEAPLEFEFLARPARMRPNTAAAMPEVSADFKTFTVRLKPGIYFADDAAFKGRKRELVAADYVYALKRHFDPRWKSGNLYALENLRILGLSELRRESLEARKPFDYDREVEGLRTLDRYTFQIRTGVANPRLLYLLTDPSGMGAVAREVVEHYGDKIMEHPVGTGPFRLAQWKRSSRIVLERNPGYRELRYDEHPAAGDARLQAIAAAFKGRRLPLVDRVEVAIVEENQPRWLAFLNGEHDVIEEVPPEFVELAMPNGKLAPNHAKRGVTAVRYPRADVSVSYFAMENPVVGGYEPHKVALRRAISLAVDVDKEIRLVRRGQAIPAQSPIGPQTFGYEADFKSEMSDFDLARARALLDMHGYVDRDSDGWREQPDGQPLTLVFNTQSDQANRQLDELWKKNMTVLGLRSQFKVAQWPENLKAARAGSFMVWGVGSSAAGPDGQSALERAYGPSVGKGNLARVKLPAFDAIYDRLKFMPDGAERQAGFEAANKLLVAYAPYRFGVHRINTDLAYPRVVGFRRPTVWLDWWQYVDLDDAGPRQQ